MTKAKAFLSWSTADPRIEPLAQLFKQWLGSLLSERVDFFFSREIAPGEHAVPSIYKALNEAHFGFIFLSQRTARSPWVIYESGCLNPSLRAGRVFPLLFDLSPKELRVVCPPLADFQAVSLRDVQDVRRLTEKLARMVGLGDTEMFAFREQFQQTHPQLERAITETVDSRRLLPDRFTGTVTYNENITGSRNFQMPQIFDHYQRELFLVGNNLNFLLNLHNNTEMFGALLDSLVRDPSKTVRILVADLWDEKIRYTFNKIIFGNAMSEFAGLDDVLTNPDSTLYLDRFIADRVGSEVHQRLRRQLTIKKLSLLFDTFWFVDPDGTTHSGDLLFALMTAVTGRERPVFYVNQAENPGLFSKHFDMCRAAFDLTSEVLWPVAGPPR
ncbi:MULTISPECIES: toll/interleukin-1 receptor domain-containing protein [unclassified Streptomyces]|uniref:toll/interleukin-1 receptor domain-containing protein n=1 Tax=unclassified Streptomyces TaxID=2593676 RepID=UPI002E2A9A5B|nr:toll/interleukin-1 receptor domain-containing protein [Streptomyces sp. NBC_01439]